MELESNNLLEPGTCKHLLCGAVTEQLTLHQDVTSLTDPNYTAQ